ncbi:hypothetical protein AU375_03604 [Methylobacterium radiotolerans]|nr:hypothetical protein AU375_03604 [Methylobacterium radiotolerans]
MLREIRRTDPTNRRVICFTSLTYAYLARARVLFESLRKHQPQWKLIALITDQLPNDLEIDLAKEPFDELATSESIIGAKHDHWLFGHDIVAACTAIKGPFLRRLLDRDDCDLVVYLDPDTCLFRRMDELEDLMSQFAIALTPHQLVPSVGRRQIVDDEIGSLRHGIYNLGFLAVSNTEEGRKFARWWEDRLLNFCFDDPELGLFVDQRWCDHVPVLFNEVKIIKNPGYNVASWNIAQRHVAFDDQGFLTANNEPLYFCHFTKVGSVGDIMLRRNAGANFQAQEVWHWYERQLAQRQLFGLPRGWWKYGTYRNGEPISAEDRRIWRSRFDLQDKFENPFDTGPDTYKHWLTANASQ